MQVLPNNKKFSLTRFFPDISMNLSIPRQLANYLTFLGFPDKLWPCN